MKPLRAVTLTSFVAILLIFGATTWLSPSENDQTSAPLLRLTLGRTEKDQVHLAVPKTYLDPTSRQKGDDNYVELVGSIGKFEPLSPTQLTELARTLRFDTATVKVSLSLAPRTYKTRATRDPKADSSILEVDEIDIKRLSEKMLLRTNESEYLHVKVRLPEASLDGGCTFAACDFAMWSSVRPLGMKIVIRPDALKDLPNTARAIDKLIVTASQSIVEGRK